MDSHPVPQPTGTKYKGPHMQSSYGDDFAPIPEGFGGAQSFGTTVGMNCATAGTNHIPGYAGHLCNGSLEVSVEKKAHAQGPAPGDRPTLKPNLQRDYNLPGYSGFEPQSTSNVVRPEWGSINPRLTNSRDYHRDYSHACKANLEAIAANRVSTAVTNAGPARQLHRKLLSMQGKLPEGGSRFWDY